MAILNAEATQETHIPIIVPFVHIENVRVASLLLYNRWGNAAPIRDNALSARLPRPTCSLQTKYDFVHPVLVHTCNPHAVPHVLH